jgi:hypothetical protein
VCWQPRRLRPADRESMLRSRRIGYRDRVALP